VKAAFLLALALAGPAQALTSAEIDALWNYYDPAASEKRFRAERARWPDGSAEALEIDTQVARALGLQDRFDDAKAVLDRIVPALKSAPARAEVRWLLEWGRTLNSSGNPQGALSHFRAAAARSADDRAPDAEFYRIDALHMLAIAAPPAERIDLNRKALAAADAATEPRARGWRASLLNNLGWSLLESGDPTGALDVWQQALVLREAKGDVEGIRFGKWTVARGLRANGRLDEAERMQRALAAELPPGDTNLQHVRDELAEIAKAKAAR
jgi:tetratricopeptide (TPR) repeat protein